MGNLKHNNAAQPGDTLFLTRPLGVGIISTAIKHGKAQRDDVELASEERDARRERPGGASSGRRRHRRSPRASCRWHAAGKFCLACRDGGPGDTPCPASG